MSILPSENQGPTSSSNNYINSQNPNSNHGSNQPQLEQNLQSIHISDNMPDNNATGSVAPTPESSGGSSKKVKEEHKPNGKKIPSHQKSGAPFQHNGSGQSGVGFSQHRGSPGSQNRSRSTNQGGTPTSAGRRGQGANANYLLNFQYDPIARPQARVNYPRRLPKRKPYNKDLFLQANYKFVLLDSGNRAPESMDPDKMLQWEDIICLKYFTPHPTTCPICLEELLCPQMTSCGHIFCFPCILRYFLIGEDEHTRECWKKCPLCFMMISSKDLYTIYIENVKQHCVGDIIEFMLLTRDKDSLTLNAKQKERVDEQEEVYDSFSKFTFTSDVELSVRKAMSELDSWLARAESGLVDDLERLPYVCAAMEQLEERKKYWKEHRDIDGVNAGKNDSFRAGSPPSTNFAIGVSGWDDESFPVGRSKLVNIDEPSLNKTADTDESYDDQGETLSSSPDDSKDVQIPSDGFTDKKIKASYDFYQEEETRCKKADDEKKPKAKANNKDEVEEKSKAKRPDLKSLSLMQHSKLTLVPKNRIGSIPGVDVGHQFFSRCEMVTVGFHNHWLCGIDYIGISLQKEYPEYKLPLTVAIVMSGMYEDDVDNSADVVYTGQGGNDLLGNKRQIADQVLARGNLGLKHSMEQNVPVRVIRGHESKTSYVGKVYTYDGLYKVVNYWAEKGKSGFTVYKFKLKRVPGQPQLVTEQVFFSRGAIPTSVAELQGLVCEDISGGLENIPIPATNVVDEPPVPPTGLTYISSLQFAPNVVPPSSASGCNCKGSCTNPNSCACARLNGSDFPYVHRDGGRLIEPKAVVFECGPNCGCGPSCVNRTTQRGLKYRLEVYKTPMKGWAVRSWDFIPSGAFVCEYIGVLKKAEDVHDPENMYIFDIDCLETMNGLGQRESRLGNVPMSSVQDSAAGKEPKFCIDAGTIGNVTRYINHSCQPNLFVQCVLSAHHDITQARVILFAADNIQPLKELTYDYGYALDSVQDPEGNIKQLPCYCGAPDCRKRMF